MGTRGRGFKSLLSDHSFARLAHFGRASLLQGEGGKFESYTAHHSFAGWYTVKETGVAVTHMRKLAWIVTKATHHINNDNLINVYESYAIIQRFFI